MKILIVGTGHIGKALFERFDEYPFKDVFMVNRTNGEVKLTESQILESIAEITQTEDIDVLINCVGHFENSQIMDEDAGDKYNRIFDANVRFAWLVASTFYDNGSLGDKWKYLVNIGSESAFISHTSSALYCASKAALTMLTKNIARDYGELKFCTFQVDPGIVVDSEMARKVVNEEFDPAFEDRSIDSLKLAKFVDCLLDMGPCTNGNCYPIGILRR